MKTLLNEHSEAMAKELRTKLDGLQVKDVMKSDESTGGVKFKIVITTESEDRDGEVVKLAGVDTTHYMKNAVVLGDHSYKIESIIGRTDSLTVKDGQMVAEGEFTDATELGRVAGELYKSGFLFASSISFLVKQRNQENFAIIEKSELLEFSFVAVQSNRDALKIDEKLYKKGLEFGFIQEAEAKGSGISSSDSFQKQMKALLKEEKLNVGSVYVTDIFKDELVYNHYLHTRDGANFDKNYRRGYTVDESGVIALTGADIEVQRDRERVDVSKIFEVVKEIQADVLEIKSASHNTDDNVDENINEERKLVKDILQQVNRFSSSKLHELKNS